MSAVRAQGALLLATQNADGGWPYQRGGPSWTEPTAYALLALAGVAPAAAPVARGLQWLTALQRPDGGWPPEASVPHSTWVTAVVALLEPATLGTAAYRRAVAWTLRQTGADTNAFMRLRQWLTGDPAQHHSPGWPWFPDTSAWVTPTALSMLALRKSLRWEDLPQTRARLDMGAAYLLAHTCSDSGWNHGAARSLNHDAPSYPETTGVALLALTGSSSPALDKACDRAQAQLSRCRSSEAESWLRLGLLAHGQFPQNMPCAARPARTIQNAALALLADRAAEGHNLFL